MNHHVHLEAQSLPDPGSVRVVQVVRLVDIVTMNVSVNTGEGAMRAVTAGTGTGTGSVKGTGTGVMNETETAIDRLGNHAAVG